MNINVKSAVYTRIKGEESIEIPFNFYTNLRAIDKLRFVNNMTNIIVDDNTFNSIIFDLIFNYQIIDTFTDIDISEIKESADNIGAIEDMLIETNIVDIVTANVEDGLIDNLRKAVKDNIAYRTGICHNEFIDAVSNFINTLTRKIDGVDTDVLMQMAEKINQLTGDITPEKIINAYAETDIFKQNQQDRIQAIKEHMRESDLIGKIVPIKK